MIREDTDRFGWLVRLSFGAVMKGVNDPHSKQPHSQCVCTWCVRNFVRCVRHVHEYSYKIQTIDAYNDLSGICPSSISNIIGFNCNPPGVITGARGRRLLMELQVRWR